MGFLKSPLGAVASPLGHIIAKDGNKKPRLPNTGVNPDASRPSYLGERQMLK